MTNKEIIRLVNKAFSSGNTDAIMEHVADDVTWEVPGAFSLKGKDDFRKEASNPIMASPPVINVINEIEEGNLVAVEGEVRCLHTNGNLFTGRFFDFYRLENAKIKEMRSYVIEKK